MSFTDRMRSSEYGKNKMTADFGKEKLLLTQASGDGSDNEISPSAKNNQAKLLTNNSADQNDKDKDGQEKSASEA